jgi:hypothetical protein
MACSRFAALGCQALVVAAIPSRLGTLGRRRVWRSSVHYCMAGSLGSTDTGTRYTNWRSRSPPCIGPI